MRLADTIGLAVIFLVASTGLAHANARLVSVVALDGGCVAGPTGHSVQTWDIEPGRTYSVTISGVTDCGLGGTAPTIDVRVNNSAGGNKDLVASLVAPGTYSFTYEVPLRSACSGPILYCATKGAGGTGKFVLRNDGGEHQAHLRVSTFRTPCADPTVITERGCSVTGSLPRTWGEVKAIYR